MRLIILATAVVWEINEITGSKPLRLVPYTKGKVIPSLFFSFPWQKWTKDQTGFRINHNQFYSWRDPTILISHTNIRNMTLKASLTVFFFLHQLSKVKQFHKLEAFTDFFFKEVSFLFIYLFCSPWSFWVCNQLYCCGTVCSCTI